MQFHRILSGLVAITLAGAPLTASAETVPVAAQLIPVRDARPAAVADTERYAELEKQSPAAATFEGGGNGVYIGGGALTVVLIILIVLVLL